MKELVATISPAISSALHEQTLAPEPATRPPIQTRMQFSIDPTHALWARFLEPYAAGSQPFCKAGSIPTTSSNETSTHQVCPVPAHLVRSDFHNEHVRVTLIETDAYAALLQRPVGAKGTVTVRACTAGGAANALAEIQSWFPNAELAPESVRVDFWQSGQAMFKTTRAIEAPTWDAVSHHYPTDVRADLQQLMSTQITEPAGRVILWHGAPGTGKTSAIRALAQQWREQARMQIVLDPEAVFSRSTDLMQVILDHRASQSDMWRVLVIEDADEIVRAGNDRTVRSLSRLLNVGDGIVGQGLKVLILLTTNEAPSKLHPALTRPGRCLSHVPFRAFTRDEAATTFPDRAVRERSGKGDLTLAEILNEHRSIDDQTEAPGQYL